jgi:polyphosphate:AMP phosphotransferase
MMFEAAELGRKVSKKEFARLEPELRTKLLQTQRELAEAGIPVIVIVSGVEGAGKGEVVNRLHEWLDTRGISTSAFWDETDEEREHPTAWRFWRRMPERGKIAIFFGSWYSEPIVERAFGQLSKGEFELQLDRIASLERMLSADGALILKLWFHLSKKEQSKRIEDDRKEDGRNTLDVSPFTKKFAKRFDKFAAVSERAIRRTDTGQCAWRVIESTNRRYRDLATGFIILDALRRRLDSEAAAVEPPEAHQIEIPDLEATRVSILDGVDLGQCLGPKEYDREFKSLRSRLNALSWKAWERKKSCVALFEGWDAAGKGGAIRRVTRALDARLFRVVQIAAPTDEERAHHYLWRFWRSLPRAGHISIYDRSWYGRVMVERVEGFAHSDDWRRAYREINAFEEQLCEHGITLLKFWMHISPEEQLRRFREREQTPHKTHKITEEDWRNREKWGEYEAAVNEMVAKTSTSDAPWTLVAGDDKRFARIQVLRTFVEAFEKALDA